jgi:hypothetical protein
VSALRTPPLEPLRACLERLERARLRYALGASGLLAALDLVDEVNDWDVTVDADVATLETACAGLPYSRHGNSGCHADHKLTLDAERTELIAHFAFFVPGGVVRIPTVVTRHWRGVPVGSPAGWAVAYALMGELEASPRRRERAERLFGWMDEHGADAEGVRALLAEPLPPWLRERVAVLPVTGAPQ